jgi:hypothetical protein
MSIASYASYLSKARNPYQKIAFCKITTPALLPGAIASDWLATTNFGATPTVPTICDRNTLGALGNGRRAIVNASSGQRVSRCTHSTNVPTTHILYDRLSHMAGLSGIVTGAQTTNLPTAALTRYTSGSGVVAFIEYYTAVGATATTITISYTNQAGVAGRTSPAMAFGSSTATRICQIIALQAGDTGVRSVESVNIVATTGTAGNFGITLGKILGLYPNLYIGARIARLDAVANMGLTLPKIQTDACLGSLHCISVSTTPIRIATIDIIQE